MKLSHIEWINNKILLYSTGEYIQYSLISYNGREYEKGNMKIFQTVVLVKTLESPLDSKEIKPVTLKGNQH